MSPVRYYLTQPINRRDIIPNRLKSVFTKHGAFGLGVSRLESDSQNYASFVVESPEQAGRILRDAANLFSHFVTLKRCMIAKGTNGEPVLRDLGPYFERNGTQETRTGVGAGSE